MNYNEASEGDLAARWAAYDVDHGVIVARGSEVARYRPLDHPGLMLDLAKLKESDEGQALRFGERWGLMSYRPVRASVTDEELATVRDVPRRCDQLSWLWTHGRCVRIGLELAYHLQRSDEAALERFITALVGFEELVSASNRKPLKVPVLALGTPRGVAHLDGLGGEQSYTHLAQDIIISIVGVNLDESRTKVIVEDGSLAVATDLSAPIVAAYHHFAQAVTIGRLKRCIACKGVFPEGRAGQLYCPEPPSWTGISGSPCGALYRKRRQRQGSQTGVEE